MTMPPLHPPRCTRLACRSLSLSPTTPSSPRLFPPRPSPTTQQVRRYSGLGAYSYTQAKALVFSEYGDPSQVLNLHQHSISPGLPPGTVLLRTLAAPINPADINTIQGTYGTTPPFTTALGTPTPTAIPGNEAVFEILSTADDLRHSPTHAAITPGAWAIPATTSPFGTWRTHALVPATAILPIDRTALSPLAAATVSVNPCTAYRLLRAYGPADPHPPRGIGDVGAVCPLAPGSGAWFIQNGANSAVGRAAIQFARAWGLRSINVVRERATSSETTALCDELTALGADVVVTETELLARGWKDRLAELTRGGRDAPGLALNCVGGASAIALAKSLAEGGSLVTYGAMARKPAPIPAGLMIFKDIRFVGFWLSRWAARDPIGKRHAVNDILAMIRNGSFVQPPVEEVPWRWDTKIETLRDAVAGTLGGMRRKGVLVFEHEE